MSRPFRTSVEGHRSDSPRGGKARWNILIYAACGVVLISAIIATGLLISSLFRRTLLPNEVAGTFAKIMGDLGISEPIRVVPQQGYRESDNDGYSCWLLVLITAADFGKLEYNVDRLPFISHRRWVVTKEVDETTMRQAGEFPPSWWDPPNRARAIRLQMYWGESSACRAEYWLIYDAPTEKLYLKQIAPGQ